MPVLHLLVGPNGSGKSTLFERVVEPATGLPFVNADRIARARWPGDEERHAYDAARMAADQRGALIASRRSFVAETVFSHVSKLELVRAAQLAGYIVILHVVLVPEELCVRRCELRAQQGGHSVPEQKVRERFARLWPLVEQAIAAADEAIVYDNTRAARPFREVARYLDGRPAFVALPRWSPIKAKHPR